MSTIEQIQPFDASKEQVTLPFSAKKQVATLGWLLVDKDFFLSAVHKVKPEWFLDLHHARIWRNMQEFYLTNQRVPTVEELREVPDIISEDPKIRAKLLTEITVAVSETRVHGIDTIIPELTEWLKSRIYHSVVIKSTELFNNKRPKEAYEIIRQGVREIEGAKFRDDSQVDWSDWYNQLAQSEIELIDPLSFGLRIFDQQLLPHAKGNGSLLRGDTTVVLAPSNVGKTSTLITVAMHNVKKGKDVLFLTHEGRPEDIREKVWLNMLRIDREQLFQTYRNPENASTMSELAHFLNTHLTYIPINKAGLAVEEVEAIIRIKQEERIAKTGKGYDLLVDDYPDKLMSSLAKNGALFKRNISEYVYNYFVQLALEYKFHALVAIQSNRTGFKINKNEIGVDKLLDMDDVHEAFGPMQIATNVVTINRDPEAEAKDAIIFKICKSRASRKGQAIACKSEFAHCITHSDDLPAVWYNGFSTLKDKMDELIRQFNGGMIPDDAVFNAAAKGA